MPNPHRLGMDWLRDADRIRRRSLVYTFALGVVASVLVDARMSDGALYAVGLAFSVLMAIGVLAAPRRFAILPLFLFMICAQDLTQSEVDLALHGVDPSATLWQIRLFGLSRAITVFGLLIVAMLRLPHASVQRHQRWLLFYLFVVAPLTSLFFGFATDLGTFVSDAKLLMFAFGLIYFRRYFAKFREELPRVLALFLALAGGRYFVDFAYLVLGIVRTEISDVNRVSVDSAKGLLVVLMIYLLYQVISGRWRIRAATLLTMALVLLIAYATRWLLLTLIVGIVLFGILVGARRAILTGVAVGVLLAAGITAAAILHPETLDIAQKRLSSLTTIETGGVEAVDLTRVISIVNSQRLMWDRHATLTGLGYGSWYTDNYLPYPPGYDLVGGFDPEWIAERRFYRVHDFVFHMLLKLGVIGLSLYIAAFLTPLIRLWRRRRVLRYTALWEPTVILWGASATVLTYMYWSGKGLLLSALFVAIADAVERASRAAVATASPSLE